MEATEQNLEKLRDEKVFPVAKAVFKQMSEELVGSTDENLGLALKTLSLMVEKDLNVDTEVSFLPQVILRTLAEINSTLQVCETDPEDEERYVRVAHAILTIVSDADLSLKDKLPEDVVKDYEPIKEKLNVLFKEEKITRLELNYIKDMIFDAFTNFNNIVQSSIVSATERAESKALGIQSMTDLSLKRLDEFLKG